MVTFDTSEAYNPYSITNLIRIPTYERYVVWCGRNKWISRDICSKEIRSRAQTMITILNSIINIIRRNMFDHLMHEIIHMNSKKTKMTIVRLRLQVEFANDVVLLACSIS